MTDPHRIAPPGMLAPIPALRSFLFVAQLGRLLGHEDAIKDALLQFTQPVASECIWCPRLRDGHLDCSALQ